MNRVDIVQDSLIYRSLGAVAFPSRPLEPGMPDSLEMFVITENPVRQTPAVRLPGSRRVHVLPRGWRQPVPPSPQTSGQGLTGLVDINAAVGSDGTAPLMIAASKNHAPPVRLLLQEVGATPDAANGHGETVLSMARRGENGQTAELLRKAGTTGVEPGSYAPSQSPEGQTSEMT